MSTLFPLIVFLVVSAVIGIHASARIRGRARNFFVGGNIMPVWVVALSLSGQAIDVGATAGNARDVIAEGGGFWAGASIPLGLGCSLFLIGLFYAKPLHRLKLLTLVDFFYRRYDSRVELLTATACVLSSFFLVAANLAGFGTLIHFITGIPASYAMVGVAGLVLTYAMAGGLFATSWNDILHVGVAVVGLVCPLTWLLFSQDATMSENIASADQVLARIVQDDSMRLPNMAGLVALALGDVVALDFMERVLAAKTPSHASRSCAVAGVLVSVVGLSMATVGVYATLAPGAPALFEFVRDGISHAGVRLAFSLALVAACISTIDGALMATSTVVSRNILQRQFPNVFRDGKAVKQARLLMIPVALCSLGVALYNDDPANLLVKAFDVVLASCFVPLTLGIYWKKGTSQGAFYSIILASTARLLMEALVPKEWWGLNVLVPPVLSAVSYVVVSLATHDAANEKHPALFGANTAPELALAASLSAQPRPIGEGG